MTNFYNDVNMICVLSHFKRDNILERLTFNDFDWSANDLVSIYLLFYGRGVYVFISFAWQLQRTLSKLVIGLLFVVHGEIVRLTISLWTLHLIVLSDDKLILIINNFI